MLYYTAEGNKQDARHKASNALFFITGYFFYLVCSTKSGLSKTLRCRCKL